MNKYIKKIGNGFILRAIQNKDDIKMPVYQWLLNIPDMIKFLLKIKPILEKRIAESAFTGFSGEICINLYKEAFLFQLSKGNILKIESLGLKDASIGSDGGDICIPSDAFIRLVFGYRSIDDLLDAWPDIVIKPEKHLLFEVLFPKITSYFCMPWYLADII